MKIYKHEVNDGISELVKSQASIAYISQANVRTVSEEDQSEAVKKIIAGKSNPDQIDLYYLESVLVSTGWNKNDDVFTAEATWDARSTPEDKQFNFMHNENDIIGHITDAYVLDKEGKKVSADQDESPMDFDIITEAVLYNSWTDPENRERMSNIIAEIEEGKWFVSMECLFSDFAYALVDPKGIGHVLPRNEDSAFLTKHLRAYGGEGKYEGYTIGRALKNISFSGKGLVSNPANPRSIILEKSKSFVINQDISDKLSIGDFKMSDNNHLEKQVLSLQEDLAAAQAENDAIKAKIEEAKDKEFASTVEAFEADVQSKDEAIAKLEETVKSTQAKIAELEDALATSQEQLETAQSEIAEMVQKEKTAARKSALTEAGLSEEEVEESLATFESLEDDAFAAVVSLVAKKAPPEEDEEEDKKNPFAKKDKKEDVKAEEAEAEEVAEEATEEAEAEELEEAFEEVETSEAALVEAEEEVDSTKAAVADWLASNVLSK